jgi:hypothetical protein
LASNVRPVTLESGVIGAFDFNGGERSYFAYGIPVPSGTALELLLKPQVLNPGDSILMRSTDENKDGIDDALEAYIVYEETEDPDYFGVGKGATSLTTSAQTVIFNSSNPSVLESLRVANKSDDPDGKPISVYINGSTIVKNLIVPISASVEVLELSKRINTSTDVKVQLGEAGSIDVQLSGKEIIE